MIATASSILEPRAARLFASWRRQFLIAGVDGLFKPIRHKPQSASNGDERPNRENAPQPAVLQAFQTQPQPSQHNERGYEYTCNTLRFLVHSLRVAQKLIATICVLVARPVP
jgi:hypothetical protein